MRASIVALFVLTACGYQLGHPASRLDERGLRLHQVVQGGVAEPRVALAMQTCLVRELGRRGYRPRGSKAPRLDVRLSSFEEADPLFAARRLASSALTLRFELRLRCGQKDKTLWRSGLLETRARVSVSADLGTSLALRRAALDRLGCEAGRLATRAVYGWALRSASAPHCAD